MTRPGRTACVLAVFGTMLLAGHGDAEVVTGKSVRATVICEPAEEDLVYRCVIKLTDRKTGAPVGGAVVVITADMPSMPTAHHMRPIEATPGDAPGIYQAMLKLEMAGRWALRIKVTGPITDQIVHAEEFTRADKGRSAPHPR